MLGIFDVSSQKRCNPRIPVETFCTEIAESDGAEALRHGLVVDLSADGLRIQRPLLGRTPRLVRLELELPEVDEVMWAQGAVRFDEIWRLPRRADGGLSGVVRTTGIEIVSAASRHKRMLREYVVETWRRARMEEERWLLDATCYARG